MSHLLYRSMLANELIAQFSSGKTSGPSSHIPSTRKKSKNIILQGCTSRLQNVGDHLPVSGEYNGCRLCSTKKNIKRSKIHCNSM